MTGRNQICTQSVAYVSQSLSIGHQGLHLLNRVLEAHFEHYVLGELNKFLYDAVQKTGLYLAVWL